MPLKGVVHELRQVLKGCGLWGISKVVNRSSQHKSKASKINYHHRHASLMHPVKLSQKITRQVDLELPLEIALLIRQRLPNGIYFSEKRIFWQHFLSPKLFSSLSVGKSILPSLFASFPDCGAMMTRIFLAFYLAQLQRRLREMRLPQGAHYARESNGMKLSNVFLRFSLRFSWQDENHFLWGERPSRITGQCVEMVF